MRLNIHITVCKNFLYIENYREIYICTRLFWNTVRLFTKLVIDFLAIALIQGGKMQNLLV
jgi:hypothetical protein